METVDFTQGILPQFIDGAQMNLPLFFQGTDFTNTTIDSTLGGQWQVSKAAQSHRPTVKPSKPAHHTETTPFNRGRINFNNSHCKGLAFPNGRHVNLSFC